MRATLDFSPLFRSGIGFDRVFDLLDSARRIQTKVSGASLDDGLLHIELVWELSEEMRPRHIEIGYGDGMPQLSGRPRQLESEQKEAA